MKASRNYRKVHPWLLTWNPTIMVDFCFSCFSMWCFSTLFPCLLNLWSCVIFLHVVFSMVFPLKHLQVPMSLLTAFCHFSSRWFPAPGLSHRQVSSAIRNGIRRLFFGAISTKLRMDIWMVAMDSYLKIASKKITISNTHSIHGTGISTYMKTIKINFKYRLGKYTSPIGSVMGSIGF